MQQISFKKFNMFILTFIFGIYFFNCYYFIQKQKNQVFLVYSKNDDFSCVNFGTLKVVLRIRLRIQRIRIILPDPDP